MGIIALSSAVGEGTTFRIFFPRIHPDTYTTKEAKERAAPTGSGHILLVDDEEDIRKMLKQMLVGLGYQVTVCSNSRTALETFQNGPRTFDLVITDLTLPQLSGDRLARELLKLRPDVPIILITGFSDQALEEEVLGFGIRAVLRKPVQKATMGETISRILC